MMGRERMSWEALMRQLSKKTGTWSQLRLGAKAPMRRNSNGDRVRRIERGR